MHATTIVAFVFGGETLNAERAWKHSAPISFARVRVAKTKLGGLATEATMQGKGF